MKEAVEFATLLQSDHNIVSAEAAMMKDHIDKVL
jgi:hypothetical protein